MASKEAVSSGIHRGTRYVIILCSYLIDGVPETFVCKLKIIIVVTFPKPVYSGEKINYSKFVFYISMSLYAHTHAHTHSTFNLLG